MNIDGLIPRELAADLEERRKARMIVYATMIGGVAAFLIFLILSVSTDATRLGGLTAAGLLLVTYIVLAISKSTKVAAHFFLLVTALAMVSTFSAQSSYSVLAVIALPIAATHLLGIRAGAVWTVLGALWAAYLGPFVFFAGAYDNTLSLSVAVMTVVVGLASLVVESTRAHAAQEAHAAMTDLSEERTRTRQVVQSVFPGLIDIEETQIVYAGPRLVELSGYTPAEVLGTDLLSYIHPDDLVRIEQWVEQLTPGQSIELRLRHKDGRWIWVKTYYIPSDDVNGRRRRTFAGHDVTHERDDRERSIQTQRLEGIGVLAAGVAHDFNNLLTVITGFAELMEESASRDNILSAADDAAKLVLKLMAFGKSSPVDAEGAEVTEMMLASEPVLASLLAPTVHLHIRVPDEPMWVPLSLSQMNQLVLNLVTNAKEALPDGGNVWIDVEAIDVVQDSELIAGEYVQISVSDDGSGMDIHTLQHAFDPFYTTKLNKSGTGLGLASVYGIARHAGGSARLQAELDAGTTVTLRLPRRLPAAVDAVFGIDSADFQQGQGTILVVEDDELIADLVARTLVQAGYCVTIKNDVESAWRQIQLEAPDLLVTDIMMPDGRGTELARRLRSIGYTLPILFISGYSDQEIGEWKDAVGQVKFLAKPFHAKELLERVSHLMAARAVGV